MSIVQPQVRVFQRFNALPSELTDPLRAFIIGPEYRLHKFAFGSTQTAGDYDASQLSFTWATLGNTVVTNGFTDVVEPTYTRLFLEDAQLEYFDSDNAATLVAMNFDSVTQISFEIAGNGSFNLVDAPGEPRNVDLDKDVAVGDRIIVTSDTETVNTVVTAILQSADSSSAGFNAAENEVSGFVSVGGTAINTVNTDAGITNSSITTSGSYAPDYKNGVNEIVYSIEAVSVVGGSSSSDVSQITFDITSNTGTDDAFGVTGSGDNLVVNNSGVTLDFSGVDADVTEGDVITLTLSAAHSVNNPVVTPGTGYTGTTTKYIVQVVEGGDLAAASVSDRPRVRIYTLDGSDSVTTFTAEDQVAYSLGNNAGTGTIEFSNTNTNLFKGEYWEIDATGATNDGFNIVRFADPVGGSTVNKVQFALVRDIEVQPETNLGVNWTQDATQITLNTTMREFDNAVLGGEAPLRILSGKVGVTWRGFVTGRSVNGLIAVDNLSIFAELFDTQIDPDNPLVYGIFKALQNSGDASVPSSAVFAHAVVTDDEAGYANGLGLAETRDDIYAFAPMSKDPTILGLVQAHIENQSSAEVGQWRIGIFNTIEQQVAPVLNAADNGNNNVTGKSAGANVDIDNSPAAGFIDAGVRTGDILRAAFVQDKYAQEDFDEYVIASVNSNTQVTLTSVPPVALSGGSKIEVWRNQLPADKVTAAKSAAGVYGSRRIVNTYPSSIQAGGLSVDGMYLSAAIAGLIGASAPQQGLTNVTISGFDNVDNVANVFSKTQLDDMAGGGVWIVTEDFDSGAVITRHQLTTDPSDLNSRELSVVKNVDSVSKVFRNRLKRYIGRANVTPTTLEIMRTECEATIDFLRSSSFSPLIGGQVLDGTEILELRAHALLRDKVVVTIRLDIPYPLNYIDVNLVI